MTCRAIVPLALFLIVIVARGEEPVVAAFNGKDLTGWQLKAPAERSKWLVGQAKLDANDPAKLTTEAVAAKHAQLVNAESHSVDLYTAQKFGDCRVELEVMIPKGSNSGIYLMGEYEVQVFDSYGKEKVGPGDMGGIYGGAAPKVNACKKPGEWQTFVIDFQAPRFEDGKKVADAKFIKVILNGEIIHENVEVKGPTPACLTGKEAPTGPLMFQGDHGPVAYRNIKITTKK